MDYGSILTRAWRIIWENKWLILLGVLVALGSSSGGGGGGGAPAETPEMFGDDIAQFFLRMEGAGDGTPVHGVRATHLVDVRGVDGVLTSKTLWRYTGDTGTPWERMTAVVKAACGGNELEASLDISSLGRPEVALVIVSGWDGVQDMGSPAVVDDPGGETRADGPLDGPLPIPEFSDVVGPVMATTLAYALVRRRRRR